MELNADRLDPDTNIVLIVMDACRADHLGCYGYDKPTSPNIDKIASKGLLFKNCYATANCTDPSLTSILSGKYPLHHGVTSHGSKFFKENLRRRRKSGTLLLPELLKGHDNACVDYLPLMRDRFKEVRVENLRWTKVRNWFGRKLEGTPFLDLAVKVYVRIFGHPNPKVSPEVTYRQARRFVKEIKEPFFLFIHDWSIHTPYIPSDKYMKIFKYKGKMADKPLKELSAEGVGIHPRILDSFPTLGDVWKAYDTSIRQADEELNGFINWLEGEGIWNNILFILTSDHGENLEIDRPIFGHGGFYYTTLHVPLIIHHPKLPSVEVNGTVSHIDIVPTTLDTLSIREAKNIDGKSLLPIIREENDSLYNTVFAQTRNWRMVRTEDYKLIRCLNPREFRRKTHWYKEDGIELYNLKRDPDERENIVNKEPDVISKLKGILDKKEKKLKSKREKSRIKHLVKRKIS